MNVGATIYNYTLLPVLTDATEIYAAYDLGVATISYASTSEGANDGDTALALSYGFDIAEGVLVLYIR